MTPVTLVEVSPRDGLQNESCAVSTADKLSLIERLAAIGATRIEVTSFVNPRRVPQMADADTIAASLPDAPGVSFIGLCLNERGVDRAVASSQGSRGIDEIGCVMVATDPFGIANQGQTVPQGLTANRAMISAANAAGRNAQVTIAASFGCPFEGAVDPDRVLWIAEELVGYGAREIAFADTIGVAVPRQVGSLVEQARRRLGDEFPIRVHLHDTRGMAPANAWAAYQEGCRIFDSALGGIGGCPFAPNAAGNLATEELIYLFGHSGVDCGIALDDVLDANRWLAGIMDKALPSRVGRAGDFTTQKQRENA